MNLTEGQQLTLDTNISNVALGTCGELVLGLESHDPAGPVPFQL